MNYSRCRKSRSFRKSRFRRVGLRCSMWNHPLFYWKSDFQWKFIVFEKCFWLKSFWLKIKQRKDVLLSNLRFWKSNRIKPYIVNYMSLYMLAMRWHWLLVHDSENLLIIFWTTTGCIKMDLKFAKTLRTLGFSIIYNNLTHRNMVGNSL